MSKSNSVSSNGGIGFGGLLALVFIVLKLTGVIGWSWWWVLSPLWIGGCIGLAVMALALVAAFAVKGAVRRRR